jgi:hypothetical protein
MLRSLFTWFLLLGAALAISACCVNNTCDCRDTYDNVVFFRFNVAPNSPGGFTPQELDTIYIQRKPVNPKSLIKADTVRLIRALADAQDSVAIGPNLTFGSATLPFTKYQYTIWPAIRSTATLPRPTFVVDSLHVESTFADVSGCCTCYKNIRKDLHLNGKLVSALDESGQDQPVYITLSKL